jgi:hypothetical protein
MRVVAIVALLLACLAPLPAAAARRPAPAPKPPPQGVVRTGVTLRPVHVRLAETATLDGSAIVDPGVAVRWAPPANDSLLTWSDLRAWRAAGYAGYVGHPRTADTVHVHVSVQAFATGVLSIPGIGFQTIDRDGRRRVSHLPLVQLVVEPMIPANDTSAQLRPLRGPLGAPWWERVPWRWVIAGLALLLAAIVLWRWLSRRRRAVSGPGAPAFVPALDPVQRALAELETLRGLHLPEQGRFGEHAFHLTRIARQFLESVAGTPRPGDSTPELIARLPGAGLGPEDQGALAGLLRSWDLLKFARVGSSAEEARHAETVLESFVRRWAEARSGTASRVA